MDAVKLVTHVHREPTSDGYRSIVNLPAGGLLVPERVPALAVTLAELKLR